MKVIEITHTKVMDRRIAHLEGGLYVCQNSTMTFVPVKKIIHKGNDAFQVCGSDIIGGTMMRTDEDFKKCVEWLTLKQYNEALDKE